MRLQLTFAAGGYDFVRPLADGTVKPDGIDLVVLSGMGSGERHHRMGHGHEFDICEFNAAAYLAARDRDYPWTRAAGIPASAFPARLRLRQHGDGDRDAAGPARQAASAGRRFSPPAMCGCVAFCEEHYGAPHREVTWFVEREDAVDFTPPAGLRYERVPDGVRAEKMMLDGELDALLSPDLPHAFLKGDKRIARLFADNKEEEVAYFKKTGIFPIMHVTLIKRELVERHPWVPNTLMKAFNQAKEIAYRRILNPRNVALAWVRNALEEQIAVLGPDPWEFGLTDKNRKNLETLQRYCAQQGIVRQQRPLEELFIDAGRVNIPEEV